MADEIIQRLGFDATRALETLDKLDSALTRFSSGLRNVGSIASSINSSLQSLEDRLGSISTAAKSAADNLSRISAKGVGGAASGGNVSPKNVADQIAAIQRRFGELPAEATIASQRAFQSAVTKAAEFAAKSKFSIQDVSRTFDSLGANFQGNANKLADSLAKVQAAFNRTQTVAGQVTAQLTISFETFVRIVSTQLIIRALSRLQDAFISSASAARDFQLQVARIQTIAGGTSFDAIAKSVRELSDTFGRPLADVGAGLFQTISNQIGRTTQEAVSFQKVAEQLAIATGSTTAGAVDTLSGALKSFGLEVGDTSAVASQFFKAIDLGRFEAEDLANSIGRVLPVAAEMGASLSEVLGFLASMTITGLKTSEAITQVRGALTAFQRPTKAMQEALKAAGFESGQAAIKALGLQGAIQAVAETTDGSAAKLGQLVNRERGLLAFLAGTGARAQETAEAIRKIGSASEGLIGTAAFKVMSTDAQRVNREIEQLKNFFTVELGQAVLKLAANTTSLVGGMENITRVLGALSIAAKPVLEAFAILAGATLLGRLGAIAARIGSIISALKSLPGGAIGSLLGRGAFLVGGAVQIGQFIGEQLSSSSQKTIDENNRLLEQDLENFRRSEREKVRAADEANQQIIRGVSDRLRVINAEYLKGVADAAQADSRLVASAGDATSRIINLREKLISELTKKIGESRDIQIDSERRAADIAIRNDDRLFQFRIQRLNDFQKAAASIQRGTALSSAALGQFAAAIASNDKAKIDTAIRAIDRSESALENALTAAQQSGNRVLEAKAVQALNDLTRQRLSLENQLTAAQTKRIAELDKEKAKQQESLAVIREQTRILLENISTFDRTGKPLSPEKLAERDAKRAQALQTLIQEGFKAQDLSVLDALGLSKFALEFGKELERQPIKLNFDVTEGVAKVRESLQQNLSTLDLFFPQRGALEDLLGQPVRSTTEVEEGLRSLTQELSQLMTASADLAAAEKTIVTARQNVVSALQNVGSVARGTTARAGNLFAGSPEISQSITEASAVRDKLVANIQQLANSAQVSREQIAGLVAETQRFLGLIEGSNFGRATKAAFNLDLIDISRALSALGQLQEAQSQQLNLIKSGQAGAEGQQRAQRIQALLEELKIVNQQAAAGKQVSDAANTAAANTRRASAAALELAGSWTKAAAAARQAAAAAAAATARPARRALGGYFAVGGTPRGTDVIPAMLSKGEFVVNAESTRKFFPQLVAINAGQAPVYRGQGGVTNNFGDINVNVTGGSSADQTARAIASALRRELRRGTIRI
jgi:TP901 family phage tail tape measure protein